MMKVASILVFLVVATSIEGYGDPVLLRVRSVNTVYTSTYLIKKTPLNMHAAKEACAKCGGFLATIDDLPEHHFLVNELQKLHIKSAWVGLNDKAYEKVFRWDGSNLPGFKKWCPHEPNNFGNAEDCVELIADKKCLNDLGCAHVRPYICEINQSKVTSDVTV
ncbi:low affinity immunoglobulin epsilon Fc receptor-like [Clytia hemisphaerica]|uniref:C-type lectin domain-containing protein n=1 Tax=Clytia hemisphaerica TaxID=252671 RepID=A0A7M5VGZ6_9CNID